MNYKTIHNTLRNAVKADGFRYWLPVDWFDLEVGKLPEAAMQDGFTIRIINQDPSDTSSDSIVKLTLEVEFALEARRDNYLTRMNDAQESVRGLRGALTDEGLNVMDDSIWPSFQIQYLGEIVAMTFTINFEI